jgi:hypothetical protein
MRFKRARGEKKFNKSQKEGVAKVLDGITQAFIIGLSVGSTGIFGGGMSAVTAAFICLIAMATGLISFKIRGSKEFQDVN